jgi:hypothetical protein
MILMAVTMMLKAMARTRAKDKAMAMAMARTRRRHKTRTMAEIRRRHKLMRVTKTWVQPVPLLQIVRLGAQEDNKKEARRRQQGLRHHRQHLLLCLKLLLHRARMQAGPPQCSRTLLRLKGMRQTNIIFS